MAEKNTSKLVGDKGENLACEYLVKKGFKILERNCVLFCGEIDIIARKKCGLFVKSPICFVEVKALSHISGAFSPEQRANWKKQQKVKRLAEIWLSKNKIPENTPYQVDIIAIAGNEIKHFENVIAG